MRIATFRQYLYMTIIICRKNALVIAVNRFFKQSFTSSPWWKQNNDQFQPDIKNYINQISSIDTTDELATGNESKRVKMDINESSPEVQKVVQLLSSLQQNEMLLYLLNLKGTQCGWRCLNWWCCRWLFRESPSIVPGFAAVYHLQNQLCYLHYWVFAKRWYALSEWFNDSFIEALCCRLLKDCRKSCSILDYFVLTWLIRQSVNEYLEQYHGVIWALLQDHP